MLDLEKELYMLTAKNFSVLSKCAAKKVCCILVKDNNIIAIGVNGSQSGRRNCNDKFKKIDGIWHQLDEEMWENYLKTHSQPVSVLKVVKEDKRFWTICDPNAHHEWSLLHETHAEINALAKANKDGVSVEGSIAFITHSCCFNCAKSLVTFGVKEIYYGEEYDDFDRVKEYLLENNITIGEVKGNVDCK